MCDMIEARSVVVFADDAAPLARPYPEGTHAFRSQLLKPTRADVRVSRLFLLHKQSIRAATSSAIRATCAAFAA